VGQEPSAGGKLDDASMLECSDGNNAEADGGRLLVEDLAEGPWNASSFDGLRRPAGAEAWFRYTGIDAAPLGNAAPWVHVASEGTSFEVCQYFNCTRGHPQVECAHGVPSVAYFGATGCCAAGNSEVELEFVDLACPDAFDEQESGTVYIAVHDLSDVCHEDMQLAIDFG
jgi:hypothetical protein